MHCDLRFVTRRHRLRASLQLKDYPDVVWVPSERFHSIPSLGLGCVPGACTWVAMVGSSASASSYVSVIYLHFSTDRNYTSATDCWQYYRFSYRFGCFSYAI